MFCTVQHADSNSLGFRFIVIVNYPSPIAVREDAVSPSVGLIALTFRLRRWLHFKPKLASPPSTVSSKVNTLA